ncbi:MAG: response regulator transcription factor [Anaerolineae bacterium]|jgi:DNA-binding response OmpR family regulator
MTTILLVEDARDLAGVVRRELEEAGYRVLYAADGAEGLHMFRNYRPDLVILDWMLPRLDGLTVLREIRAESPALVLMLTARKEEADRVIGLEVGADDYLAKPFGMRELVARVRALLRRLEHVEEILEQDRARHAGLLNYGPIRLDPAGYRATLDGDDLNLTRTEFDLLYLLLRNPGRAFSRSYLLEAVWKLGYVSGDRSVDNAILRLRKKLGDWGEAIETVWGVGYRLRRKG